MITRAVWCPPNPARGLVLLWEPLPGRQPGHVAQSCPEISPFTLLFTPGSLQQPRAFSLTLTL